MSKKISVEEAIKRICEEFNDLSYLAVWQSNIAMAYYDEYLGFYYTTSTIEKLLMDPETERRHLQNIANNAALEFIRRLGQ